MPKGLVNSRLNSFQESELAFENAGVGSNGLRSSRIRRTKKKMNMGAKSSEKPEISMVSDGPTCLSIGRFGTCGPGAAYRRPKPRCNIREIQRASDMSGGGIEFDANVSCFNPNLPARRCCPPSLDLDYSWTS